MTQPILCKCGSQNISPANLRRRIYQCRKCRKYNQQAQRRSLAGVATHLRNKYYLKNVIAAFWARILLNPYTRCAICGLPNYELHRFWKSGPWFVHLGTRRSGWRLHFDHMTPGVPDGNYRPLCPACNWKKGANLYDDATVLRWVSAKWRACGSLRFLWWLNTEPGVNGRLHRSTYVDKKNARLVQGSVNELSS